VTGRNDLLKAMVLMSTRLSSKHQRQITPSKLGEQVNSQQWNLGPGRIWPDQGAGDSITDLASSHEVRSTKDM
jgi:hypothetical protein